MATAFFSFMVLVQMKDGFTECAGSIKAIITIADLDHTKQRVVVGNITAPHSKSFYKAFHLEGIVGLLDVLG